MTVTPWWRDAVIYQVYLRSFADGNGDGMGDIAGIRAKLPYLAELGIDAIWINPWYPSPQKDAGYDVSDFRAIDPAFGTLADAEALIAEAHAAGIRVILDIVPNHTSDQHAWFQAALAAPPGSPERARYVIKPGRGPDGSQPPTNWPSAFGGSAWQRLPDDHVGSAPESLRPEWYLHLFAPEQPDLNWENPEVRAEFEDILRFWFDRGVDGFRIDVANGLVKDPAYPDNPPGWTPPTSPPYDLKHPAWDQDGVHEIYQDWRRIADSYAEPRVFVGEVWARPLTRLARYVRPDELHTAFNFDFLVAPWDPAQFRTVIDETIEALGAVGAPPTWVLSNHDVIRVATRYGRAAGQQLAPAGTVPVDGELGLRRARAGALLSISLPGGVYIYQGEELGLVEVEDLPEEVLQDPTWEQSGRTRRGRDGCRVPIPWSGTQPPFGFSTGTPWLPQPQSWAELTAEAERADAGSMFSLYAAALRIRRSEPALGDGTMRWLESPDGVLAFARDPGFACVANLSDAPVELPPHRDVLLSSGPLDDGKLPVDQAVWLRTE